MNKGIVLYVGGFELPDKNAAAQRVIGIAKGLRELQYEVVFLNSLKKLNNQSTEIKTYYGFICYEYRRESDKDYLISAKTALNHIQEIGPSIVIAYNYPGIALNRIREYCKTNGIICIADTTEWYQPKTGSVPYRVMKMIDTAYRMRIVQKKMDGVITISRFLYNYYENYVNTVMIPPTVDIIDEKWNVEVVKEENVISFVYAGSPSAQKERLDLIVNTLEDLHIEKRIILNIVGITKEQFLKTYNWNREISERIVFWGRVEHNNAIKIVKASDWAIIIRDNNYVVNAGFPTKLVESISCNTPVIVNRFSNIDDYINESNSVFIEAPEDIDEGILKAVEKRVRVDNCIFDYHNFTKELKQVLSKTGIYSDEN